MKPVSPVLIGEDLPEIEIAKDQPEYNPLPVIAVQDEAATIISRWELSDEEVAEVVKTKSIYVFMMTFGHPIQPLLLQTEKPTIPLRR